MADDSKVPNTVLAADEVARVMSLDLGARAAEFELIAERLAVELVRADSEGTVLNAD